MLGLNKTAAVFGGSIIRDLKRSGVVQANYFRRTYSGQSPAVVYVPVREQIESLSANQNHKSRAVCRGNPPLKYPARGNTWTAVEGTASSE